MLDKIFTFEYNNCGNILGKRTVAYTLKPEEALDFAEEIFYAYDGDRLLSYNGDEIVYENGNPIHYRGNTLSWEHGKLKQFGGTMFSYDGYGRRIKKGNTVFAYDANSRLIKQSDSTNTLEFFYDESGLNGVRYNGTDYIYRKNAQGDITHICDATSGMVLAKYVYDAWGNHKVLNPDGTENTNSTFIGNINAIRYRGYYYDVETGLYYLITRYYDPINGRFISPDDISYLDPESIHGLNLYAYCGNNPVMGIDPEGTSFIIAMILGLVIGAIVGAAGQFVSDIVSNVLDEDGEFQFSSWETYVGAAIGSGFGGLFFAAGTPHLAGFVTGFVTTLMSGALELATGRNSTSVLNLLGNSVIDGGMGLITSFFPGADKFSKAYQDAFIDLAGGFAKISFANILKGAVAEFIGGLGLDLYYGTKNSSLQPKYYRAY